ncbi:MAG: hypothetical protein HGA22_00840 [Clostridiales bacterium]|nr:hypothetical protein [Clostridiales bacterium]
MATILTGLFTTVLASNLSINAVLSDTIKLKLNGKDWTPKDPVTGDYYKPISYNGRTYLPVRAVVEEAAKMPVDFDTKTQTVWIGGKIEVVNISESAYYKDYYGTIVTTDAQKLSTPDKTYKWGITNDKDMDMQVFGCYIMPNGDYKNFRTSIFLDSSAKDNLIINFRKDTYNGDVIKTVTIKPGETLENIGFDIGGIEKICIESNVQINHGIIKKLVLGEPIFYNGELAAE